MINLDVCFSDGYLSLCGHEKVNPQVGQEYLSVINLDVCFQDGYLSLCGHEKVNPPVELQGTRYQAL